MTRSKLGTQKYLGDGQTTPMPSVSTEASLCLSPILDRSFSAVAKDDTSGQLFRSSPQARGGGPAPFMSGVQTLSAYPTAGVTASGNGALIENLSAPLKSGSGD